MKKDATVEDRIREIIVDHLGTAEEHVTGNASLFDDLGADSLDGVEIVMAVEEAFDIAIPDEEAEDIKTVQQLIDCVKNKT